jgi:dihydroorotase
MQTLTIPKPDDWHVHLRDGAMLKAVLPYTARVFARAIVMPNLWSPVTTTEKAHAYRDEIIAATPEGMKFTPLMTAYLSDATHADDIAKGHSRGILTAAKLYPAHATTNSSHGVTNIRTIYPVLEKMQSIGMPLLVHGEVTDPDIDIFDREAVFIDKVLAPLRKDMPGLKIVFEHITTAEAAAYVEAEGTYGLLAATVTAHHLHINRNAMFQGGIRPHYYCLPVRCFSLAPIQRRMRVPQKKALAVAPVYFLRPRHWNFMFKSLMRRAACLSSRVLPAAMVRPSTACRSTANHWFWRRNRRRQTKLSRF